MKSRLIASLHADALCAQRFFVSSSLCLPFPIIIRPSALHLPRHIVAHPLLCPGVTCNLQSVAHILDSARHTVRFAAGVADGTVDQDNQTDFHSLPAKVDLNMDLVIDKRVDRRLAGTDCADGCRSSPDRHSSLGRRPAGSLLAVVVAAIHLEEDLEVVCYIAAGRTGFESTGSAAADCSSVLYMVAGLAAGHSPVQHLGCLG